MTLILIVAILIALYLAHKRGYRKGRASIKLGTSLALLVDESVNRKQVKLWRKELAKAREGKL